MHPARVLLVDDHVLFRQGLGLILMAQPDFTVVADATSGIEAVRLVHELQPDLILIGLVLPDMDGIEATRLIKRRLPTAHVMILTADAERETVYEALVAGAVGLLLKNTSAAEMLDLVRRVLRGQSHLAVSLPTLLQERDLAARRDGRPAIQTLASLTPREREVLGHIADNRTNKEIAATLKISLHTVKRHVSNILVKLNVTTRRDAQLRYLEHAPGRGACRTPRRATSNRTGEYLCT